MKTDAINYPPQKLIKLTMEFDDGEVKFLEGDEADRWLKAVNNQCVMEHVHGRPFPSFNWKVKK